MIIHCHKDQIPSLSLEQFPQMGISLQRKQFIKGPQFENNLPGENVWILLEGAIQVSHKGQSQLLERNNIFKQNPSVLHLSHQKSLNVENLTPVKWLHIQVPNERDFDVQVFSPSDCESENRGKGTCSRIVRQVFDYQTQPLSELVVGEVVNFEGHWSSYPPHHHPQPEVYHYFFNHPHGFGIGQVGDDSFSLKEGSSLCIPPNKTHIQTSAPGYPMMYTWIVRHLPGKPYTGFEFDPRHTHLLEKESL